MFTYMFSSKFTKFNWVNYVFNSFKNKNNLQYFFGSDFYYNILVVHGMEKDVLNYKIVSRHMKIRKFCWKYWDN